jgi:hypothetical protein
VVGLPDAAALEEDPSGVGQDHGGSVRAARTSRLRPFSMMDRRARAVDSDGQRQVGDFPWERRRERPLANQQLQELQTNRRGSTSTRGNTCRSRARDPSSICPPCPRTRTRDRFSGTTSANPGTPRVVSDSGTRPGSSTGTVTLPFHGPVREWTDTLLLPRAGSSTDRASDYGLSRPERCADLHVCSSKASAVLVLICCRFRRSDGVCWRALRRQCYRRSSCSRSAC